MELASLCSTCPIQRHCFLVMMVSTSFCWHHAKRLLLEMVLGQKIRWIFWRLIVWKGNSLARSLGEGTLLTSSPHLPDNHTLSPWSKTSSLMLAGMDKSCASLWCAEKKFLCHMCILCTIYAHICINQKHRRTTTANFAAVSCQDSQAAAKVIQLILWYF